MADEKGERAVPPIAIKAWLDEKLYRKAKGLSGIDPRHHPHRFLEHVVGFYVSATEFLEIDSENESENTDEEKYEEYDTKLDKLCMISSVTEKVSHRLIREKLDTVEKVASLSPKMLAEMVNVGVVRAEKIILSAKELIEMQKPEKKRLKELEDLSTENLKELYFKHWRGKDVDFDDRDHLIKRILEAEFGD